MTNPTHGRHVRRTRDESEAMAFELRAQGLKFREIAERMGVAISTVDAWINDPGGRRLRARQYGYRGTCGTCGGATTGCRGFAAPTTCADCLRWPPDAILEAIRDFAAANGGVPPLLADCRHTDSLPAGATVKHHFGTWNAALLEAGFEVRCDRRPETWQAIFDAIAAGEPTTTIADRYGVSREAIHQRCRRRGLRVSEIRKAAAADAFSRSRRRRDASA